MQQHVTGDNVLALKLCQIVATVVACAQLCDNECLFSIRSGPGQLSDPVVFYCAENVSTIHLIY